MIFNRSGQSTIEGLIVAVPLCLLLTAGGLLSLAPLAVFFVEDAMEEALICAHSNPEWRCQKEFDKKTHRLVFARWIGTSHLSCREDFCQMRLRWLWSRPLPQISNRTLNGGPP